MSTRKRTNYALAADRRQATKKAPKSARAPRTEPIRVTLDLEPAQHQALKRWCNQAALDMQLPAVSLASVLRILGQLLTEESAVAEMVQNRLTDDET